MNRAGTVALAKRMLDLIDRRATDLAPHLMREPVTAYTSPDVLQRERDRKSTRLNSSHCVTSRMPSSA